MVVAAPRRDLHAHALAHGVVAQVRADFQRLLLPDGILAGFAWFHEDGRVEYLAHPSDRTTGLEYSLLPIIHAIINELLTPEQADAVRSGQVLQMLAAGGNAYYLAKLAGIFGLDMQDIGAQQTGVTKDEFKAKLVAANDQ